MVSFAGAVRVQWRVILQQSGVYRLMLVETGLVGIIIILILPLFLPRLFLTSFVQ